MLKSANGKWWYECDYPDCHKKTEPKNNHEPTGILADWKHPDYENIHLCPEHQGTPLLNDTLYAKNVSIEALIKLCQKYKGCHYRNIGRVICVDAYPLVSRGSMLLTGDVVSVEQQHLYTLVNKYVAVTNPDPEQPAKLP